MNKTNNENKKKVGRPKAERTKQIAKTYLTLDAEVKRIIDAVGPVIYGSNTKYIEHLVLADMEENYKYYKRQLKNIKEDEPQSAAKYTF